jgi:hypothetical protein
MRFKPLIKGLLTFIPGVERILPRRATGGTDSAPYCYTVWLKHLTLLRENGMVSMPAALAELGPGDSLGIGLAGVLSGADRYYALDVARYSDTRANLKMLEELVALFETRAPRPIKGWPDFDKYLDEDLFPRRILDDGLLKRALAEKRLAAIRKALEDPEREGDTVTIKYMVPWSDDRVIQEDTVDLVLSHSVLEHVVDLEATYRAIHLWLKPGGMMSHQIDFTSHSLSEKWNGYWAYSDLLWKIMAGKRPFLINREPHSVHLDLAKKYGFNVVCDLQAHRTDGIQRSELSGRWKHVSDDDLTCSGAFIQARKGQ